MKIRVIEKIDYKVVADIYNKYWKDKLEIPSQNGRVVEAIVENENNELVAYGMMKLWAEIMMIMDSSKPNKEKVEALKLMMQTAEMSARKNNIDAFHIFTNNESYANILLKHFNCERINCIVLRKRTE